jgi:hypothetical protein
MAVLSNNGRLISTLPATSIISATDEFLIQSNGITKRTSYAALTSSILSAASFNPFINQVKFTNVNNKFTGSFYGNVYGTSTGTNITITAGDGLSGGGILTSNRSLVVDSTVVRTSGTQTVGGSKTFSSTILGNITSTGTSTFSTIDVNGGTIDGATVGASSATTIIGTTITANTGFVGSLTGNVTGNLTGDVYNSTTTKVLESGNTTTTPNGGVSSAYFYGTSSYANQALTAAYAATGGTIINGIPTAGTRYQLLAKNSGTNYDVNWTNPITSSNLGNPNNLVVWDGTKSIRDYNNFYWNGIDTYVCTAKLQLGKLTAQSLSGSFFGGPTGFRKQGNIFVSFWGTGSRAVTASYAATASYLNSNVPNPLGILTQTSPNVASTYKGSSYTYAHSLGSTPYYFRSVLICSDVGGDPTAGYIRYDEVEAVAIYDSSTNNEHTAITSWTNPTYLGASCLNNGWTVNKKSDGTSVTLDPTLWKIKFYYK